MSSIRCRHSSFQPDSEQRGHGGQGVARRHVVAVVDEIDRPEAAAHVVDVVRVPVVRGVDRADRPERGRPLARRLQRVESRVAVAEHADATVRPRLLGQPGDHVGEVVELDRRVLVGRQPLRRTGAAHVDAAHREVALRHQPDVVVEVRRRREVVLPVRQRFEQRRARTRRATRQIHVGRQPRPVAHGDPEAVGHHGAGTLRSGGCWSVR